MRNARLIHHHSIGAICFLPLFLLAIASIWGGIRTKLASDYFEERANRAEQKLQLTEAQFRHMQKVYGLLTSGEPKEMFHSAAIQKTAANISAYERYTNAAKHTEILAQRVEAFRSSINQIGKQVVHIDLSDQEISLVQDGEIVARYPASSGAADTPTPTGRFQIHRKQDLRVSSQEIPYRMPNYMAFTPSQSHGMHALPYLGDIETNSDYWYEALDHIGTPVSHGCVRLLPGDAAELYGKIEVGTTVLINT